MRMDGVWGLGLGLLEAELSGMYAAADEDDVDVRRSGTDHVVLHRKAEVCLCCTI